MLSLFPEILFLSPFSALVLRIVLAAVLVRSSWQHASSRESALRILGIAEFATAVALALGFGAQAAAFVAGAIMALQLAVTRARTFPTSTLWLALAMSLSVLVTGAGALAFDLPL